MKYLKPFREALVHLCLCIEVCVTFLPWSFFFFFCSSCLHLWGHHTFSSNPFFCCCSSKQFCVIPSSSLLCTWRSTGDLEWQSRDSGFADSSESALTWAMSVCLALRDLAVKAHVCRLISQPGFTHGHYISQWIRIHLSMWSVLISQHS